MATKAAAAPSPMVVTPGLEALFSELIPDSPSPEGHHLTDIRIVRDRVHLDFVRGAERATITLRAPGAAPSPVVQTRLFDVERGEAPEALALWVAAQLRARESTSPWRPAHEGQPRAERNDTRPRSAGPGSLESHYVHWALPALWLAFLVAGLSALLPRVRGLSRGALAWLAFTVALALALRLGLPPLGPGDIKNTLLDAYAGWPAAGALEDVGRYGRGVEGLLVWLFLALPTHDTTVALTSLALGVASVPLLGALALRLGLAPATARAASLLLALCPLHVRFSPTTGRYIPMVFLLLVGWTLLLAWLQERRRRDLVVAVLALTLAAQCRPEAILSPLVTAGLLLSQRTRLHGAWRGLSLAGLAHFGLLVVPLAPLLARALGGGEELAAYLPLPRPLFNPLHNPFFSADYTPLLWTALALPGLLIGPRGAVAWAALGALFLSYLLCSTLVSDGQLLNARYHLAALPLYLLLVGNGLAALLALWRRIRPGREPLREGLGLVLLALAALPVLPEVTRTSTVNHEYAFLRAHLALVPDECDIFAAETDRDHGLRAQTGLSLSADRRHRWRPLRDWDAGAAEGCAVFYHSGACAATGDPAHEALAAECARLRDASQKPPLANAEVPAVPLRSERYRHDPVPLALYWLNEPR